jgi:sugar O-acyltransferase (sialic acid O-acetyltransferase NeuD family)
VGTPIILVAAGGLALETAEAASAAGWTVRGAVDDDPQRWGALAGGWLPVLGGTDALGQHEDASVVICAGRGPARAQIAERVEALAGPSRYGTVVHPSVLVPGSCTVGEGSILLAGTVLTANVTIGRHVVCMPHVTLTHDDEVHDFVTLCAGVTLGGSVRVGTGAYLGMSSAVREGVSVGEGSTLGMGAVLIRDLPDGDTWAGVPARRLDAGSVVAQ